METRTDRGTPGGQGVGDSIRPLLAAELAVFSRPIRGGVALVFLLAAVQTVRADEAFLWLGVLTAVALALAVPVVEWRLGTDRLVLSLPVRRDTVVRARYTIAGVAVGIGWLAWVAGGHLLAPALAATRPGPDSWATLPGHLAFLSLATVLLAAFFPLHFRFGLGRAATAFLPVALALYLAAVGVVRGLAVLLDGPAIGFVTPGALAHTATTMLTARLGWVAGTGVVVLGLCAIVWVSAFLSMRGLRHRDL